MKRSLSQLSDMEQEGMQTIGNIGTGQASKYLSDVVGSRIYTSVPEVDIIEIPENIAEVPDIFEENSGRSIAGILMPTTGIEGSIMVTFSKEDSLEFLNLVTGGDHDRIDEAGKKELKEIGERIADIYLETLKKFLQIETGHGHSRLVMMPFGTLLAHVASLIVPDDEENNGTENPQALVIKTDFSIQDKVNGDIALILEVDETEKILEALHKKVF